MRKSFVLVSFLSLIIFATQAPANGQSRARRVGQTPPPPAPAVSGGGTLPSAQVEEEVGEDDVVRVDTSLVTIPVSVLDRDGKYIPYLNKEDFRIFEDGVEQGVAYFNATEQPFTVALVIDTSRSTKFKLEEIQDAAIAFVEKLRPDDRVIVISFDDDVRVLAEATSDRDALRRAIRRTRTGGSTKLYDAVDFTIHKQLDLIRGRKALVLFTDGVDTTSRRASYESNLSDVEELDAIVYPVQYSTYDDVGGGSSAPWPPSRDPSVIMRWPFPFPLPVPGGGRGRGGGGGRGTSREDYTRASRYLRDIAEKTGGRLHEANDLRYLEQAFNYIAEELRRQYSLGYYPKVQSKVEERRQIRVRVKRPNLVVRARDSYIYKPAGATASTASPDESRQSSAPPELRRKQFIGKNERERRDEE